MLGFGLIGGSIARALRRGGDPADAAGLPGGPWTIAAWSPSGSGPRAALEAGVVDAAAPTAQGAVADADLVLLAAPPLACLDLIDALGAGELRGALAPGTTVSDVASTKAAIVARASARGLAFVGGHPMAGRETAGFGAASAALLEGRPWVVVPAAGAGSRDVTRVEELARACGARPVLMDAAAHDAAVAAISHLPLVLSAALVEAVAGGSGAMPPGWAIASSLTASGWRDMTRLARGEAAMGAGILATNAVAVAAALRDLRAAIDGWLGELERAGGPDADRLRARLTAARDRLDGG
jgi:prephenate dehydrogenase